MKRPQIGNTIMTSIGGGLTGLDKIFSVCNALNMWSSEEEETVTTTTTFLDFAEEHDLANPDAGSQPSLDPSDPDFNDLQSSEFDGTTDIVIKSVADYRIGDSTGVVSFVFKPVVEVGDEFIWAAASDSVANRFIYVTCRNLKPRLVVVLGGSVTTLEGDYTFETLKSYVVSVYSNGSTIGMLVDKFEISVTPLVGANTGKWLSTYSAGNLTNLSIGGIKINTGVFSGGNKITTVMYHPYVDVDDIKSCQQLLMNRYFGTQDVFDEGFINSIIYADAGTHKIRAAAAEWHFTYSGTYLGLKVQPSLYSIAPDITEVIVLVDGSVHTIQKFTDTSLEEITLPAGTKNVQLIESANSKPAGTILGTYLTSIQVSGSKFIKINETTVAEKFVFLGDSITVGGGATAPSEDGYAKLMKYEDSVEVGLLGYGFGRLKDFGETAGKRNAVIADIGEMFSNVSTTKNLIISLGTNDFGLDATPAATFKTWMENLLDDINADDSSIVIYVISPIIRVTDGALLDDYRTDIGTVCAARAFATHIPGKPILTTLDLADNVHPTTAGHKKYKDAVKLVINP